jgi:hypothetical protein
MVTTDDRTVATVLDDMQRRIDAIPAAVAHRRIFAETYFRTTRAVGTAIEDARFEDPAWVERWDVAFADLYLLAYDAYLAGAARVERPHVTGTDRAAGDQPGPKNALDTRVPRPWRLAFDAPADLPALRHVLLGINAHVNYDLPQALLAVISDDDFTDPVLMARRKRDHERIDAVLASRVAAEDDALGPRILLDRVLDPLNRLGSKRFLKEARQKVWRNVEQLQQARLVGPDLYRSRLAELELLSAAKIADLLIPGQVVLRLAVAGFGVVLPPE